MPRASRRPRRRRRRLCLNEMISALFYLQGCSIRNRLATRIKRLKKPKYLFGLIFGGLYFYFFLFRYAGGNPGRKSPMGTAALVNWTEYATAIELLAALVFMLFIVGGWIFPHERAALGFTEAEAVFLFSAPISRRTLIHFKLLKSQMGILVTTLFMVLISNRFGARGSPWLNILGWWIILSTINLHFLGASFARTQLLDHGLSNGRRRLWIGALLALAIAVIVYWARDTMRVPAESELKSVRAFARYIQEILEAGPAPGLLHPFRLVIRPYLARDIAAFLVAFWPAAVLLVLHYIWVIRSNVAFEEASLALAQKRAQLISAARQGQLTPSKHKARRGPFLLESAGAPAVALLWKNLIAAGGLFRTRSVLIMMCVLGGVGLSVSLGSAHSGAGAVVGMLVAMALMWSIMLGPFILRHDFRSDLKSIELLKQFPLPGWRVVAGELLAPALILTVVQWLLLLLGVIAARSPDSGHPFDLPDRLAVAFAFALVAPMLNLISFLIPNAAVLLFPGWFQTGQDATQGIEATGQRLIFGLGQFFVFLVALVPAGLLAALAFFSITFFHVSWRLAVPLAGFPAALVLGIEAAAGVVLLGKVFDKFDLSSEPQA